MSAAIKIEHLVKSYPGSEKPVVNGLNLTINEGEIFGLLGPNGAGKTTTISILTGMRKANSGKITIDGKNPETDFEAIKQVIGVVPQDIALYETLTARENLTFFGVMYGLKGKQLRDRVNSLLEIFGLEKVGNRLIRFYSGGMKRRVNLIAGILHNPKILFLDEPTVGIDVQSRNAIIEYLQELNKHGMTIVYTSHHLEEAQHFCSQVTIIDSGLPIISGKPSELIGSQPEYHNLEAIFLKLTGYRIRD